MNFPKKQPLESTKWLKYKFNRKEDNIEDAQTNLLNWTILSYNPVQKDYVLAGVITKVTEDYVEFLGDPSVVNTRWFQESSVGHSLICLNGRESDA